MKKIFVYRVLALVAIAIMLVISCTKETANVRLEPKLSTSQVLDVTADSATVVGFIVAAGDGFSEKGVCYDIATAPTTAKSKVAFEGTATAATFNVRIGNLAYATKYYARAYAINSSGTVYGDEVNFTTSPVGPTVTTDSINSITGTTAKVYGTVTVAGGSPVTVRGVVFSKTPHPTLASSKTTDGTGTGVFTSSLTGLEGLTKYYVRAYATNTAGTGYGVEDSLTTLVSIQTWNVPGDYVTASYPGTSLGNWAPDQSPQVKSSKASPNNIEGYVYMANGSNQWKFATKPNWDGPNYGDGGSGTLSTSGGNFNSSTGYYKLNVNTSVSPYTYTAVSTSWGVIGDATPAGWGDETGLTYNPSTRTWNGGVHILATKSFKFRANHSWDYNYGAPAGKDTLSAGGDNISSTIEADYAFTLDLSHPNAYTYSANYWGIIGDATPGGWGSDQMMTWDAVNKVFTVTADLTVGAFKFRANGAWSLNLGGSLGALTQGGDNIPISTAGNYTIKLDPWTRVATVTMNVK